MTRRRFAFWIGLGLFSMAEKLRVYGLDELAAATMRAAGDQPPAAPPLPVHWRAADNGVWRWFERETLINGTWTLSGITRPVEMETGEPAAGDGRTDAAPAADSAYLDESLVPECMRPGHRRSIEKSLDAVAEEFVAHQPDAELRVRHGRPPSKWLRSLYAEELRIWLMTIEVPEATVSGMTFWEHLTRDHAFEPLRIEGLTLNEQAKLHAAAHFGY
jgi:hypothetical protein